MHFANKPHLTLPMKNFWATLSLILKVFITKVILHQLWKRLVVNL